MLRGEVVDGATNEVQGMSGDVVEKVRGELEEQNLKAQDKDKVEVGGESSRYLPGAAAGDGGQKVASHVGR